jgi:hypothetical protein
MPRIPSYLKHSSGQGFVRIQGTNIYLGRFGTRVSRARYYEMIAEYARAHCAKLAGASTEATTVEGGYPVPKGRRRRVPAYLKHSSGQAFVRFRKRNFYLGKYGTPESRARYNDLIAVYLENGRSLPADIQMSPPLRSRHARRHVIHGGELYLVRTERLVSGKYTARVGKVGQPGSPLRRPGEKACGSSAPGDPILFDTEQQALEAGETHVRHGLA